MIQPPFVIVTVQKAVLGGGVHVFVASPKGSPVSCVPFRFVSAKAWIVSTPGREAVKQKVARPFASVVCVPLAGLACVAAAVGTENTTATPAVAVPEASLTVAVTQCCAPTTFVAVAGESVSVAGAGVVA